MPCLQQAAEATNATGSETGFSRRHPNGNSGSIVQGPLSELLTFSRCTARRYSPSPFSTMTAPRASPTGWLCRNTGRHRVCRIIDVRVLSVRFCSSVLYFRSRYKSQSVCSEVLFTVIPPSFLISFPVRKMFLETYSRSCPFLHYNDSGWQTSLRMVPCPNKS